MKPTPTPDTLHAEIIALHEKLRKETRKKWNRVLPFNDLLFDRWEKAQFLSAKKGANVYDSSYIYGNVSIGKNTWVGPNTLLDGSGGRLSIGDYCSISSGVQIYTHQTVNWALTGGKAEYEKKGVSVGSNCYIGPYTVVAMGSRIGRCSVIGAHSFVNGTIPSNSIAFGIPAKVAGKVIVKGKNVRFVYDKNNN